jgi:hypothetical protein
MPLFPSGAGTNGINNVSVTADKGCRTNPRTNQPGSLSFTWVDFFCNYSGRWPMRIASGNSFQPAASMESTMSKHNKTRNKTKKRNNKWNRRQLSARNSISGCNLSLGPEIIRVDDDTFCIKMAPADTAPFYIYMLAHELLPLDYDYVSADNSREVENAIATLTTRVPTETELLRAIAILGHSPCSKALDSLADFSHSDHPYASVARLALSECKGMMQYSEPMQNQFMLFSQPVARA